MFDVGFGELLLIAVVALVVLGPERLPKAARFAGLWVRRARNQWDSVKQELERELQAEELRRNLDAVRRSVQRTGQELHGGASALHDQARSLGQEVARDGAIDPAAQESTASPLPEQADLPTAEALPDAATQRPEETPR